MKTDDNRTRITMLTGSYRIKGTVELVAGDMASSLGAWMAAL